MSVATWIARAIGWVLVALAVLNLPLLKKLSGPLALSIGIFSSVALALAGFVWLAAVEAAAYFFNRYLSRN